MLLALPSPEIPEAPVQRDPASSTTNLRVDTSTTSELMLDQPLPAWAIQKAQPEPVGLKSVLKNVMLVPWPMLALMAGMVLLVCGGMLLVLFQLFFGGGEAVAEPEPTQPVVVPPTVPQPPKAVFLSDLPELDVKVGHGRFGKKGDLGYEDKRIVVKGLPSLNGLSMHPPANGAAAVSYLLAKKYQTFKGTAAINDDTANTETALTFKVLGDGKLLWQSRPLKNKGDVHECSISVKGIERLTLEVHCPGGSGRAHSVWAEPQLLP